MVYLADKNGSVDSAYHTLVKHIDCWHPIVMTSWVENFVFNDELLKITDYVLVCFCEYGWDKKITDSHIWGRNTDKLTDRYVGEEWRKFDNWVRDNPPKIMFKRELLAKDVTDSVVPIEYPCVIDEFPVQTKEEFNKRPLDFFQYWGRSNECRIRIQGEAWLYAFKKGFQLCDNVYYVDQYLKQESGRKAISLWIPHYARIEISGLMQVNNLSKLSLSWPGAGFKCFRTCEASANSVMVQHKNNFAWSHDWNESNCLLVEPEKEFEGIEAALQNENLYDIYLQGMINCDKYRLKNYLPYLEKLINDR